jgi:hypothetical protein
MANHSKLSDGYYMYHHIPHYKFRTSPTECIFWILLWFSQHKANIPYTVLMESLL